MDVRIIKDERSFSSISLFNSSSRTNSMNIEYSSLGQPYIVGEKEKNISISHSGYLHMGGISKNKIGVDIERIKLRNEVFLDYISNSKEQEIIGKENVSEKITKIWVIKESVLKGLGVGLRFDLDNVKIVRCESDVYYVEVKNLKTDNYWKVYVGRYNKYYYAIAICGNENGKIYWYGKDGICSWEKEIFIG